MLRQIRHLVSRDNTTETPPAHAKAVQLSRFVEAFEAEGSGWFWETDAEGRIIYLSEHVRQKLMIDAACITDIVFADILEVDPHELASSRTLRFHLSTKAAFRNVSVRATGSDATVAWSITGRPKINERAMFEGYIGSGSDLAERRQSQAAITRLAYSDALTGLANRERMRGTLENLLFTRQSGFQPTALLLLDLDRFKAVNDTLGHQTGDELLKQVAQRLQRVIGYSGVVGRLGGDEFQVIIASDTIRANVEALSQDIIVAVSQPYSIDGNAITIGCSIGIAIAPEHGQSVEELVRNADLALYAAKDRGRGLHHVYNGDLHIEATRRREMEDDLRHALANDELHIVYQPVVSTMSERIVGYEALVRWQHTRRGVISPAEFIPIAEEAGLIAGIGEWVLRTAIRDCATWPADIRVAVNVSPAQFSNLKFPALVANALNAASLDPARLELEITESVFLNDDGCTDRMFKALKNLGVRLALDDFGTGYSALGYLKNAPFDKIKIDQSFVRGAIQTGNRNAAIIRAIVTLATTFGMETTAEGVEHQDEIAFVRDLGCSHIQGYVYGRPERNEHVLSALSGYGVPAEAVGHKVSRPPREKVIRKAQLSKGGSREEIVIRNVSRGGAMIEGSALTTSDIDTDVLIELLQGQIRAGQVRWVDQGKAGICFRDEAG